MKPKLRFPGYEEEWGEKKLGEVCKIFDGMHSTPTYLDDGIPFYSVENIRDLQTNKYISQKEYDAYFKKNTAEKYDIFMTRIGSIGETNIILDDIKCAYYVSLALLKPKGINSYFLNQYIKSNIAKKELWKKTLHVAFPKKINKNDICEINIRIPTISEQEKIGEFFLLLDQRIEKQEEKIELMKERKKGWMQKVFNQEIRFKDENDNDYPDWEEKKLGDIVDKQLKGKKSTESDGGNILLTTDYLDNGILSYVSEQNNVTLSDLLILWDGSQAGKVYIGHEGVLGSTFMKLELCNPVSENYTYQFLIFRKKEIQEKWRTGSGIPHVSKDFISSFVISLPTLPEQEKIANFLSVQDELIEKEEEKLNLLKEQKKGLLQQMFV